jgi:hypothetical protein
MASRLRFLAAALMLLVVHTSSGQTPQPTQPNPTPMLPLPLTAESTDGLTPAQQRAIAQLLDAFFGKPRPTAEVPVPVPAPPPLNATPVFPQANPGSTLPLVAPMPMPAHMTTVRFQFKIDAKAPMTTLLPAAPKTAAKLPMWTNEDLTKVPELRIGEPLPKSIEKNKGLEATAHMLAKVNHLNAKKTDGFMLAMLENRPDLRGLPFLMGDDCRTREEEARTFHVVANVINQSVRSNPLQNITNMAEFLGGITQQARNNFDRTSPEKVDRAIVAALTQILMPESARYRVGLAKYLGRVQNVDATRALARLAIFSPEEEVRIAALDGLKLRRERDYTDILVQGFRYPLPAVAKRSAEALVKLERNDLVANLLDVLERPDPRLPVSEKRDGKETTFVRELVKVNHHHNCALCHAPGNTPNVPDGVLTVAVPLPSEPLPKPSQGGYQSTPPPSPDVVVRIDMTYLRQDFSVMMPVADAHPWPEMQRFDFLVRTRELTASEAQAYEPCCDAEEPGRLSPYHRSALYALRELTGRDAAPTAEAWRKLLKLPRS